jgi:hypothetical protein
MSSHNEPYELLNADFHVNDPGTGARIAVTKNPQVVDLVIAAGATETNTLASPVRAGMSLTLFARSVGASGVRTVTVASAVNQVGDTTLRFDALDDLIVMLSVPVGGGLFEWRVIYSEGDVLHNSTLATGAGAGFTDGVGAIYKSSRRKVGDLYITEIDIDLTGTASSTTDLDIIGSGTSPAYIAKLTALEVGATVLALSMQCLEAPAGGVTDIDLYSATEGTGKFDDAVTGLTETPLITAGGAWTNGAAKGATTVPLATEYLYVCGGAAGTAAAYTAGKFRITIIGYD